jgi:hypothetical protein
MPCVQGCKATGASPTLSHQLPDDSQPEASTGTATPWSGGRPQLGGGKSLNLHRLRKDRKELEFEIATLMVALSPTQHPGGLCSLERTPVHPRCGCRAPSSGLGMYLFRCSQSG